MKQLISASTAGPQWGQSFDYGGFGNLRNQVVTKDSAPSLSVTVDGLTNRITTAGYGYDNNGNLTAMTNLTLTHDVENRLVQSVHTSSGTERYVYDPSNQRVWKQTPSPTMVHFCSVDGTLLATYGDGVNTGYSVHFAGKQIWALNPSYGTARLAHRLGGSNRPGPGGSIIEERIIMTVRESVHQLVDALPESRLADVLDYLADLRDTDTSFSSETQAAIEEGLDDIRHGRTITLQEYRRTRAIGRAVLEAGGLSSR
jgi:YD repeat-containing protein